MGVHTLFSREGKKIFSGQKHTFSLQNTKNTIFLEESEKNTNLRRGKRRLCGRLGPWYHISYL